jgi:hypothetical protein
MPISNCPESCLPSLSVACLASDHPDQKNADSKSDFVRWASQPEDGLMDCFPNFWFTGCDFLDSNHRFASLREPDPADRQASFYRFAGVTN